VSRRRRRRPPRRAYTFVCRACRLVLDDGVDYTWCPKCNATVDWIDGRFHVWTCDVCDLIINKRLIPDEACPSCHEPLVHVSAPLASRRSEPRSMLDLARIVGIALLVIQAVFALLDPDGFPYLRPLLVFIQLAAIVTLAWFVMGSNELRALASDRSARIIHGIEHATASVLEERGLTVLHGQTTHGLFLIELAHDGKHYEDLEHTVGEAAADAVSRIRFGEHRLAYDARCGTSMLVAIALLAFAIVGSGVLGLLLDVPGGINFALTVFAGLLARVFARRAGLAAQRWLTVSTEFSSAIITRVDKRVSSDGKVLTAIVMVDVIPLAVDVSAVAPVPL